MYRRIMILALTSVLFGTASAKTFEAIEGAHEAVLADVILPGGTSGTLIFKLCDSCDATSLSVDSSTVYNGSNGPMPLAEFRDYVAEIRLNPAANQNTAVGIYFNLDTNRVTRVSVFGSAK